VKLTDLNPSEVVAESPQPALQVTQNAAQAPLQLSNLPPDQVIEVPTTENEENYGGITGEAFTAASHLVNTALPGIGPILQNAVGVPYETQRKLSETNPISAMVGDIGGFARGVGAPGLISKAGTNIASGIEGAAGKAIQYGAEGALYNWTNSINDMALGDPNLTAQKALIHIGLGAALGVGGGLLSEAISRTLPQATKKLSSALGNLRESTLGTVDEPTIAANALGKLSSLANGKPVQSNLDHLFAALGTGETTIPKVTNNLEEILEHGNKVSDSLNKAIHDESGLNGLEGVAPDAAKLSSDLKTKELLFDYHASLNDLQNTFMDAQKNKLDTDKIESFLKNPNPQDREILDNYIENSKKILSASENYADYKQAETSIGKLVNSLAKNNVEMQDTLKAMTGKSGLAKLATAGAFGTAAHMAGVPNPLIGTALGALEAYRTIKNPYEVGTALNNVFQKLKVLADINQKVGDKINSLSKSALSNAAARNLSLPKQGINSLPEMGKPGDFDKKSDRIYQLATNPEALMNKLSEHTEDLEQAAPNVSVGLHKAIISSVQFLNSKLPRPQSQLPLSQEWTPSRSQKQTFMNYYRTVSNPLSSLKDLKEGTLSDQTMEALQATHPELLQEMRQSIMQNIDPKKAKKLPFGVKMSLSKFLGHPMIEGVLPSVIMSNQVSFIGPQQSQQNAPKQTKVTQGGLKALNMAGRSETETQEHEKEDI